MDIWGLGGAADEENKDEAVAWGPIGIALALAFTVVTGAIILSASGKPGAGPAHEEATLNPAAFVTANLNNEGFPWLTVALDAGVATVSGTAPNAADKAEAFTAAESAIQADADLAALTKVVVDNIAIEGGEAGIGQALAGLGKDASAEDCRKAFSATLDGRMIQFASASATISPESARLLDALAGVTLKCMAYQVEIGGHTDQRGPAARNQALSQARAEAVRDYLIGKGAGIAQLTAVGYGESKPLDDSGSRQADAANRRIEFTING